MRDTPTVLSPVGRGRRAAACLLAAVTVVVLAGCGSGDLAAAGDRISASPSAPASPTPTPTPSLAAAPTPEPSLEPSVEEPAPAPPAPGAETPRPTTPTTPQPTPTTPAPRPTPSAAAPAPAVAPAPALAPAPAPAAPAPAVQASGAPSTAGAQALLTSLNGARSAAGLAPLGYSSALESVASGWTSSMAGSGTLGHNPSYSAQIPAGARASGENVGYAGGFADNAATIHSGWMDSPGHRENILRSSFTQVGIGFVVDANGTAWATQVFAGY